MVNGNQKERVVIDLKYSVWSLNDEQRADDKLLPEYIKTALEKAGGSTGTIVLTGAAPNWLYMAIAVAFYKKCVKLVYNSPRSGDVVIFNHGAQ